MTNALSLALKLECSALHLKNAKSYLKSTLTLTHQIFKDILPFIQSAVDGENVCILAYGQTGSGKTHTMEGPNLASQTEITDESGILPRTVDMIFKEIQRLEFQGIKVEV